MHGIQTLPWDSKQQQCSSCTHTHTEITGNSCHNVINHCSILHLHHLQINTRRHRWTRANTLRSCLLRGRPCAAAVYDGKHPTLPPTPHRPSCHCDTPRAADSPKAPRLQARTRTIYSSGVQLSNNSTNHTEKRLILHSWFPNNRYTQANKQALAQSQIYARTETHAHSTAHVEAIILLLVKSLLYSLLFSQARESNLSTKECWEICHPTESWDMGSYPEIWGMWWGLKPKEYRKWSSTGTVKLLSWSLQFGAGAKTVRDVRREGVL